MKSVITHRNTDHNVSRRFLINEILYELIKHINTVIDYDSLYGQYVIEC